MQNGVKNPQPAQSAPVADVQPTKQAQFATVPSGESINNHNESPQYEWVRLRQRDLYKTRFSEHPEMYLVHIDGTHRNGCVSVSQDDITVELLYEDFHPYLAVGRSVIDFMNNKIAAQIHDIYICKRTIKNTKSHK